MQRGHPVLTDRIRSGECGLCFGDRIVIQVSNQAIGRTPGLFIGFTHNDVQADAETDFTPASRRFGAYLFNFLFYLRRRFAPGEIEIDLLSGEILCDIR